MTAIDKFRDLFKNITFERGDPWMEKIPAFIGKKDGTVQTGTFGMIWVRDYSGQALAVFNNVVEATPNIVVLVGRRKDQPTLWQVVGNRDVWSIPGLSGVMPHHEQHQFMGPDMGMWDRRQIYQLSAIVSDAAAFKVQVFGAVVPTANGLVLVDDEILDFSSYVPDGGALYVTIEIDDDGNLSLHAGDVFGAPELADVSFYPQPEPGKYPQYVVLLYEGLTELTNDLIKPIMPMGAISKGTGLQIDEADSDIPQDNDKFPFWDVFDQALKSVPWGSIKPGTATYYTDDISNPPTEAEITLLLGDATWRPGGYNAFIKDSSTGKPMYWCISDGSRWHFFALTKSLYESADYITLSELDHYDAPGSDIYTQGMALADLNAADGLEMVLMSGGSLLTVPPVGRVTAFDATGSTLWTFESPTESYGMLADAGDVNGDGQNEVAVTFNVNDSALYLLDRDGNEIWHYQMVGGGYARGVRIGKVRPDYPNNQIVVGGWNGQLVLLDEDGTEIWRKTLGSWTVQSIRIADIDGDDQNEIIIAYDRDVRVYNYLGNLVWSTTIGDVDNDIISVDVGNVTGDVGLEIIAVGRPRWGLGSVRGAYLLDSSGTELWHWDPPTGQGCEGAMLQDLDGDGIDEVIVGWGNHPDGADPGGVGHAGGITILDASGAELGTWTGTETVEFFVWGDVNNDGSPELAASGSDGQVHIFRVIFAHSPEENNLGRLTAYEDTKANAEAFAGTLSEIMFAHATDTDEIGFLVNGTWTWLSATPPITNHNDLPDLQGGTTDEYYHLTQAEHDGLTDGGDAGALHTHSGLGQYRQFVYAVSSGDLIFLTDEEGNPLFNLQDLE